MKRQLKNTALLRLSQDQQLLPAALTPQVPGANSAGEPAPLCLGFSPSVQQKTIITR